jgi:putative DNA primase/helicase
MALWAIHAHSLNAANVAPILALISPTKRCGKTRTLSLIRLLVPRPILASSISPAALFRAVEKFSPTLLIDETDTVLRDNEELRCILNSSHTRYAAYVVRTVGDQHEPRQFSAWSAKAVALIGRLPETLGDRSIIVPMRRRGPGESVERLRLDRPAAFMALHRRAARWAADHLDELSGRDPEVPRELNDRAADNWRPLLAIADAAGGEWSEQARGAALALSGEAADSEDSIRELLLADIRTVFRERKETRIFSDDLVVALCHREERPWSDWKHGNPLSPVQLARLLKPFGVGPGQMRGGTRTGKGCELKDFVDAFTRYLSPTDPSHPSPSNAGTHLTDSPIRHSSGNVTDGESGKPK